MGCLFSKNGQVRRLSDDIEEPLPASAFSARGAAHAWLQEIGLPQYAEAFEDAGFSDWDLLSCLTETDLEAITAHTGTRIPPGHRKKLLMASRQMGATGAQTGALGSAPPCGLVRRYSHSSIHGNGNNSRAGGLAAAAAAAMSLERRSNGPRPGSTSRVPSLASVQPGLSPGPGHPPHPLLGGGRTPSRNTTEDGLVVGRRSRAVGVMVPSRNSSRDSLSAMAVGHAIGYIASPDGTGRQEAGVADTWVLADGRRNSAEPGSPSVAGGPTPPRPRRRWSANKCASRGVLIGGGAGVGGGNMAASESSYGWLEPEVAASALGGAGPITDNVRQMSATSSICGAFGIGGGGSAVPAVHSCISRDLDALVMGAGGGGNNRAQSSRCQSLAARAERSYGGGSNHGLPASPPHRTSGGQPGSTRQAAAASAQQQQPLGPAVHMQSHPDLYVTDPQQFPSQQQQKQRVSSARDSAASAQAPAPPSATATGGGGGTWGIGIQSSPSMGRPGSAADAFHKSGQSPQSAPRPPTVSSCNPIATAAALPASPQQPPAVAWPSRGGAHLTSAPAAAAAAAAAAAVARQGDGDAAFPSSPGARGAGSPGSALPRFVRAIAGWAIPSPASGAGATPDTGVGAGSATAAAASQRARSGNRQRRTYQRQSVPQQTRSQSRAGSAVKGPEYAPEHQVSKAEGAGDLLAVAAAAGTAPRGSAVVAAANPPPHGEIRSGRSQRQLLVPDAVTPRGVWDQEAALCIQGRGYKPPTVARGPSMRRVGDANGRGGSGAGDGDSEGAPSSVSRPASAHLVAPAAASVAATAAAARGGGWPFVMPQLPLAPRGAHPDAPGPPSAVAAAATLGAASRGGTAATAAAAAVAAAADFEASSGSYAAALAGGGSPAVAMYGRMSAVRDSSPSMLLESLVSDASAATSARRAPPAHSSRPRDWYPSVAGTSETATMTAAEHSSAHPGTKSDADTESSADELALCGSSSLPRAHRVQIVSSAMAMAAPYNAGGGGGSAAATVGQSPSAAAAAQWPARPLQPPTRAKPPAAAERGSDGGDRLARMQVLPPEAPGPKSARGPTGGNVPHPTPGRKLDLEMLAEQVGRIMTHLSNITKDGDEHGEPGAGPAAATAAGAGCGGGGVEGDAGRRGSGSGAGAGGDAMNVQYGAGGGGGRDGAEPTDAAGVSLLRPGTRLQAIDEKRLELQHLHQDLVRRVATMAPDVAPPSTAGDGAAASRASGAGGSQPSSASRPSSGGSAAAAAESSAAEALAEVEARIRTKLAELAALTMRPDPERRTAAVPAAGGAAAAAAAGTGAGGSNSPGGTRKRALGPDSAGESPAAAAAAARWAGAGYGGGAAGHRRARDEAALHMEVLAVLGARKRQVRGASAATPVAAVALAPAGPGGSGSGDGGQGHQGVVAAVAAGPGGGLLRKHSPATAASAHGNAPGGVVLAEKYDALKAELLAIDSRIRARVRGSGAAVSRRG